MHVWFHLKTAASNKGKQFFDVFVAFRVHDRRLKLAEMFKFSPLAAHKLVWMNFKPNKILYNWSLVPV